MASAVSGVLSASMLMGLVECHHPSPPAAPNPAQADSVERRVIGIRPDSAVDSSLAVSLRQARDRSYRAAMQIDTILVHPDTLKLRVGQVVPVFTSVTIDARTRSGEHIDHFAPLFEVGDESIAGFSGPGLEGRTPGLTWLVVSAATGDPPDRQIVARSLLWILVAP